MNWDSWCSEVCLNILEWSREIFKLKTYNSRTFDKFKCVRGFISIKVSKNVGSVLLLVSKVGYQLLERWSK